MAQTPMHRSWTETALLRDLEELVPLSVDCTRSRAANTYLRAFRDLLDLIKAGRLDLTERPPC